MILVIVNYFIFINLIDAIKIIIIIIILEMFFNRDNKIGAQRINETSWLVYLFTACVDNLAKCRGCCQSLDQRTAVRESSSFCKRSGDSLIYIYIYILKYYLHGLVYYYGTFARLLEVTQGLILFDTYENFWN